MVSNFSHQLSQEIPEVKLGKGFGHLISKARTTIREEVSSTNFNGIWEWLCRRNL